ncbi:origin recognition complex subunit 4 C-terminus-domain-containing protein [Tricladium varicosporioides]|nr:origin recognition complex subunit 4 C-terminus-domain-containing protein [Hymenoscyphus varicosporioides]
MSTRKRSRAHNEEEFDELSPRKEIIKTPLSGTIKRRKLDFEPSAINGGEGLVSRLGRKVSGFFGRGTRPEKENHDNAEDTDELAADMEVAGIEEPNEEADAKSANGALGSQRRYGRKSREVLAPIPKPTKSPKRKTSLLDLDIDMWEGPVSDDERRGQDKIEKAKRIVASASKATARPRKSDILRKDKSLSRKERLQRLSTGDNDNDDPDEEQEVETPKARKSKRETLERKEDTPSRVVTITNSSRRKSKRETEILNAEKEPPKSILTPTKRKVGRPRKSVAFEPENEDIDLGFKDLPNSASSQDPKLKRPGFVVSIDAHREGSPTANEVGSSKEDDEAEEELIDTACSLCSRLHSRRGNQILLCDGDGCDFAVHQKCYDIPVIPDGDWFCNDCKPETAAEEVLGGACIPFVAEAPNDLPKIENFEYHLNCLQRALLDKLTGQRRIKVRGHDDQLQKVHQILEQTVFAGEGNSMLVIGSRGSGKTTLVESAISDISVQHRDKFHVVRLNGFIHTDDKLALKEIWRQLGREMEVEDDLVGKAGNYADTLASLLALFSHPSELSESEPEQIAKSVIFILDEFDLFTTHARQTLLYNLFDIAQAKKAPIAVFGLTTRIDVVESLEKRVKSRFSHRHVYLPLPRSLTMYWEVCREGLTIEPGESNNNPAGLENFLSFWNTTIDDLYRRDNQFKTHLETHFYQTKSIPAFFASCMMVVANLSPKSFPLKGQHFTSTLSLSPPDSKLHILQGLSDLELALLIAAARLDIVLDTDTCNFSMAYDEYSELTSRHKIQTSSTGVTAIGSSAKVWGSDIALGAWEKLAEYELLVPAGISGGGGRDSGMGGKMFRVDVGLEEITGSVPGLSGIMVKWCKAI